MVSEDQLLDRDEAIYGKDAEHVKAAEERGDTIIDAEELEDAREVRNFCLQPWQTEKITWSIARIWWANDLKPKSGFFLQVEPQQDGSSHHVNDMVEAPELPAHVNVAFDPEDPPPQPQSQPQPQPQPQPQRGASSTNMARRSTQSTVSAGGSQRSLGPGSQRALGSRRNLEGISERSATASWRSAHSGGSRRRSRRQVSD